MDDQTINTRMTAMINPAGHPVEGRDRKIEEEKLRKACADFESLFVYQLLQTMRKTIPEGNSGLSSGKDTYTMLFDQKIAEELSKKGEGMGLQTILYKQLKKSLKQE